MSGEKSLLQVWESQINVRTGARMTTSVPKQNNKQSNQTWKQRDLLLSSYRCTPGAIRTFHVDSIKGMFGTCLHCFGETFHCSSAKKKEKKKERNERRCIFNHIGSFQLFGASCELFPFFFFLSSLNLFFRTLKSLRVLSEVFHAFHIETKARSSSSWMVKSLARTFSVMSYRNALIRKTPFAFPPLWNYTC